MIPTASTTTTTLTYEYENEEHRISDMAIVARVLSENFHKIPDLVCEDPKIISHPERKEEILVLIFYLTSSFKSKFFSFTETIDRLGNNYGLKAKPKQECSDFIN